MEKLDFKTAIDILLEHEQVCSACRYEDVCKKGVSGGPNGPIYPPCCDAGYEELLYEYDAIELAEEIVNDV